MTPSRAPNEPNADAADATAATPAADGLVIRPAEPRDLPALGQLGAELVAVHYAFDPQRFFAPKPGTANGYARFLGSQLDEPDAVVLVAETAGDGGSGDGDGGGANASATGARILGYAYAAIEPPSWKDLRDTAGFIHDVIVAKDARRKGVASRLVGAAAAWLEAHGAPRIMLGTAAQNLPAQRLFDRLGFRATMIEMARERATPAGDANAAAPAADTRRAE